MFKTLFCLLTYCLCSLQKSLICLYEYTHKYNYITYLTPQVKNNQIVVEEIDVKNFSFFIPSKDLGIKSLCPTGTAIYCVLTTRSLWVREKKKKGNYLLLKKIDGAKFIT